MRIAQVSPLYESVPPQEYGGTERVVSFLTEELVRLGHDVTLFASGDSVTSARLVAMTPRSLRTDPGSVDALPHHILMLEQLAGVAREFDLLHYHIDYMHFPFSRRLGVPHLTTLHGRLDIADLRPLYDEFGDMPVVSISDAQREPLPQAHWVGTVQHGLPRDLFAPGDGRGDYLAFIGRISPEKRVDRAVEIAGRAGLPLRIAAKVDRVDEAYFHSEIEPLMGASHVEFLGEMGDAEKGELLRGARALLFPIDWPEPFGLVMIEAMACGTPTIAWPNGSVPEVLENGVTGFIVSSVAEAADAVSRTATLDRRRVRERFEARFTADRMARDYVALYETLVGQAARSRALRT
ncbi:MAG TPA: glycosyltransferase family 4 protein [Vicinamibacterales bacterium]|nr:glycosyltransferase family 4 protein [Vicinamibacterales bacterium]